VINPIAPWGRGIISFISYKREEDRNLELSTLCSKIEGRDDWGDFNKYRSSMPNADHDYSHIWTDYQTSLRAIAERSIQKGSSHVYMPPWGIGFKRYLDYRMVSEGVASTTNNTYVTKMVKERSKTPITKDVAKILDSMADDLEEKKKTSIKKEIVELIDSAIESYDGKVPWYARLARRVFGTGDS
jgi:hypothetical protein